MGNERIIMKYKDYSIKSLHTLLDARIHASFYEECINPTTEEEIKHNLSIVNELAEIREAIEEREDRLVDVRDLWHPIHKLIPDVGVPVLGFNPNWIDADFCPTGIRECHRFDDDIWVYSVWNNSQDCFDTEDREKPVKWLDPTELLR